MNLLITVPHFFTVENIDSLAQIGFRIFLINDERKEKFDKPHIIDAVICNDFFFLQ